MAALRRAGREKGASGWSHIKEIDVTTETFYDTAATKLAYAKINTKYLSCLITLCSP